MLIEKKFEANTGDITVFRLSTGEEVIARVVTNTVGVNIVVTRPRRLVFEILENGMNVGFGMLMVSVDDESKFTIPYSQMIVYPMAPTKQLHDMFIKQTTSLTVAPSGLLS